MAAISITLWLAVAVGVGAVSAVVLWVVGKSAPQAPKGRGTGLGDAVEAVFLFQDDHMFDHHSGALPGSSSVSLHWSDLRAWFGTRFEGLPPTLKNLAQDQSYVFVSAEDGDTAQLRLLRTQHGTRVTLSDPPHACPAERHQMLSQRARLTEETALLQAAPYPVWTSSGDGTVLWQNAACLSAFDPAAQTMTLPDPGQTSTSRFSITPVEGHRPVWYEVHSAARNARILHHATDISKIVSAEAMQKDFVQTLTKTFAYLTIGLAVFDRNRKLALFNPALVDLTSLQAQFLSAQPDLMAFFDSLRNRRVMPEPRSYASWRSQIGEVIASAQGGFYQETWALPNDVTYRVTGRPHPDGAIAFLFEDISAEVMQARRFRTQVDLRQSALDCLPDAVLVFSPDHVPAFCNTAAMRLLRIDPEACFADMAVADLIKACAAALPAPAVWSQIETGLKIRGQKAEMSVSIPAAEGPDYECRLVPLPRGACMMTLGVSVAARREQESIAS
ncbi:MAG: PAS-domain containing protein [Rhodobacterales bacterium]|nr:PAS-domain containing protein [Rhodobacterales bacterium]